MRPQIAPALRRSWTAFGIAVVVAASVLGFLAAQGPTAAEIANEASGYRARQGPVPLERQILMQEHLNAVLADAIAARKAQAGLKPVIPFVAPAHRAEDYFGVVYNQVWETLAAQANRKSVRDYDQKIGFDFLKGGKPPADQAEHWLKMLQLVTKSVYLSLNTPKNTIQKVKINLLGNRPTFVIAGAPGRPALLREYPFKLEVEGSLYDILWLLHQLSADDPTAEQKGLRDWLEQGDESIVARVRRGWGDVPTGGAAQGQGNEICPLIVRGLTITSGNLSPVDRKQQLAVTFDLAGMEFLSEQERGLRKIPSAGSRPAPVTPGQQWNYKAQY